MTKPSPWQAEGAATKTVRGMSPGGTATWAGRRRCSTQQATMPFADALLVPLAPHRLDVLLRLWWQVSRHVRPPYWLLAVEQAGESEAG